MSARRAWIFAAAVASFALFAGSAYASHAGAVATCDNGRFTLRAADNSGGFQSPAPDHVLIFEEGGVLTVFRLSVNGNVVLSRTEAGQANNVGTEVTCSFTIGDGAHFDVTGFLTAR